MLWLANPAGCEFRCENGQCITNDKKCNGEYDCENGEDEYDCPIDEFRTERQPENDSDYESKDESENKADNEAVNEVDNEVDNEHDGESIKSTRWTKCGKLYIMLREWWCHCSLILYTFSKFKDKT